MAKEPEKPTTTYPKQQKRKVVLGFFGLFGRDLKVVLPKVSPVSVAGIFRGQPSVLCTTECCPLKMLATETGEMLGRTTFRTRPKNPKNPQQPSESLFKINI